MAFLISLFINTIFSIHFYQNKFPLFLTIIKIRQTLKTLKIAILTNADTYCTDDEKIKVESGGVIANKVSITPLTLPILDSGTFFMTPPNRSGIVAPIKNEAKNRVNINT
jgi:hypothetical protein